MSTPLRVMLCDSSAIIALCSDGLIHTALQWKLKIAVTEFVHERELRNAPGPPIHRYLRIEPLEAPMLERMLALRSLYPALALTDASTLALAAQRCWLVLTQNPMMETIAADMAVPCRSVNWLREEATRLQALPACEAALRRLPAIREEKGAFGSCSRFVPA